MIKQTLNGGLLKIFRYPLLLLIILNFSKSQVISELEFDTSLGQYPTITHLTGTTYVGAWAGQGDDGFIATFTTIGSPLVTPPSKPPA